MPTKKPVKKAKGKKQAKKVIKKKSAKKSNKKNSKAKNLALAIPEQIKEEKDCWDYSPEEWIKKEADKVEREFKKYAPDLESNSKKSAEECARTAMTLAHHGTKKAIEALEKFKKDPRAPMWIDCGIEECEMILWEDTVGRQLEKAEKELREATEKVFAEAKKSALDKEIIVNALKKELVEQKIKFTCGETAKLYYEGKIVGEDKLEFVIDDILLVGIKPDFTDWMFRFKNGLEGESMCKGDLENIEQAMLYDEKGKELEEPKSLQEGFEEFYANYFYSLLKMSKKPEGILLDFSGEKLYGEYFNLSLNIEETGNTINYGHCSGWCEGCFEELKCETAQEWKEEEDKKRYRILKRLMKEIIEIERKVEATKRPSADLEYQMEIVEKIKNDIQEKIKLEKNEKEKKNLENGLDRWNMEAMVLHDLLIIEQPREEDWEHLKTAQEMYQAIKEEVETEEYKNDIEGLEVYYGKAKPSSEENAACYHDPFCECDEIKKLSAEEKMYECESEDKCCKDEDRYEDDERWKNKITVDDIPF